MNLAILELLTALTDGPAVAGDLLGQIERLRTGGKKPSVASFYRNLNTVVSNHWVAIIGGENGNGATGRPAQLYNLTDSGIEEMRREARRLRELTDIALSEVTGKAG